MYEPSVHYMHAIDLYGCVPKQYEYAGIYFGDI